MSALLDGIMATEGLCGTQLFCPKQPKKQEKHRVKTRIKGWEERRHYVIQDFFRKAAKSSDGFAPSSEKTYADLCSLHPNEKEPILPVTDELCLRYQFSEKVFNYMLSYFHKGTAAGPRVIYPEHLSNAIRCNRPEESRIAMQKLTRLINFCSGSSLPNDVGPTFCNASLTVMKKRKAGVRLIAVGEFFRRLVAEGLVSFGKEEALENLCTNQALVATKEGAESIIHTTKLIYEECGKREALGVLKIDFENSCNSIKRHGVLSECLKQIPCIYPFVSSCYAKHSSLFYNGQAIKSEIGGNRVILWGHFFSLALIPLINNIKQEVPMLIQNSWYLDDGIRAGTEAELMHSLDSLESEVKDLGFNVKTSKCMLWLPQTISSLDQNLKRADPESFEVRGATIETDTHHAKVF